jgi:hypothetical protein
LTVILYIFYEQFFFFNDEIEFGSTPVVEKFYLIFQPINESFYFFLINYSI